MPTMGIEKQSGKDITQKTTYFPFEEELAFCGPEREDCVRNQTLKDAKCLVACDGLYADTWEMSLKKNMMIGKQMLVHCACNFFSSEIRFSHNEPRHKTSSGSPSETGSQRSIRKSKFHFPIELIWVYQDCMSPDLRFVGTARTGGPVKFFLTV